MDPELEEQMKMLEGFDVEADVANINTTSSMPPIFTPENPINQGVVTNQVQPTPVTANVPPQTVSFTQPINQVPVQQVVQQQVNQQAAAQAVQPSTTQSNVSTPATKVTATPDVMNQAPVFVNLAASTYQTKTDFLTLKDNERTRVTLANLNFIRNHIHYIDGLGKIRCLSIYDENNRWPTTRAICCKFIDEKTGKEQNAKNRLLVPVIEYPVNRTDGKTISPGTKPKLKMWDMNYVEEKQLMSILENYKTSDDWSSIDVTTFDLSLIKGKSGEFSTITLTPIPTWRAQFKVDIDAEIAKINKEFYTDAYNESARVVSEQSIQNVYVNKQQEAILAQQMMNQQVPNPADLNLNLNLQ